MRKYVDRHLPCKDCLCMRCSCVFCQYEKYYKSLPINAGCLHCMRVSNETAVTECEWFLPRLRTQFYKIRVRRKNPYFMLAKTLHSAFQQLKDLK